MALTLGELAVRFGLALRGDPERLVDHVGTLAAAGPAGIAFLADGKRVDELATAQAAAVILHPKHQEHCPLDCLLSANPHADFARIAAELHPLPRAPAGIHASAVVDTSAEIDPSASIGPGVVIGAGSKIGARVSIGALCFIGDRVVIEHDAYLLARVTVLEGVSIGARSVLHPGCVIGSEGFGYAPDEGRWLHVPQVGSVRIGADVEIGANTTIDRGALEDTLIGEGVKIDNLVQIGHNCTIGAHTAIAACSGLAGSTHIGARCRIGGSVGFVGHLRVCDDVTITGNAMVTGDVREPGMYSGGIPFEPTAEWRRLVARWKRIESLVERVSALERAK